MCTSLPTHGKREDTVVHIPHTHGRKEDTVVHIPHTHGKKEDTVVHIPHTHGEKRDTVVHIPHTHGRREGHCCAHPSPPRKAERCNIPSYTQEAEGVIYPGMPGES